MKKWIILSAVLLIIIGAAIYVSTFKLKEVQITGCENVDEQTVKDAVLNSKYANNTLMLSWTNKFKPVAEIPFVDKIDIEYSSKNAITITVYEKSIAGCVEYMNEYVYFDKDGVILESSGNTIPGIPCIKGLKYSQWEMGKNLPIDDTTKFHSILNVTQLIDKYELLIDSIKFTNENEIVLFYKDITIELGNGDNLAIQMMNLGSILEGLEGKSGTLYMKDFDSDNATASFKESKNKK